ncbi:hypothetical protein EG68_12626, partial [Paragonimus skrjabini miyazakii]
KIEADDNEDVDVISSTWLNAARTTATIPRLPGGAYYRYARNHLQPKSDDPNLPVCILVTTINFEHAKEMEVRYTSGTLPSSDDTINMGLPQKRPIKQPRFLDDDSNEDIGAKRRKFAPTAVSYSIPSCSNEHRIPDSKVTYGAHRITQKNNCEKVKLLFLSLAGSVLQETDTKADFQQLCQCVNVQMNALRATVEQLTAEIARLANKHAPSFPLPVTSVKQLQEVDNKMLDSKFHSAMADYFRGISAPSAGALLRRMLERLMTRAVASQITYSGA